MNTVSNSRKTLYKLNPSFMGGVMAIADVIGYRSGPGNYKTNIQAQRSSYF